MDRQDEYLRECRRLGVALIMAGETHRTATIEWFRNIDVAANGVIVPSSDKWFERYTAYKKASTALELRAAELDVLIEDLHVRFAALTMHEGQVFVDRLVEDTAWAIKHAHVYANFQTMKHTTAEGYITRQYDDIHSLRDACKTYLAPTIAQEQRRRQRRKDAITWPGRKLKELTGFSPKDEPKTTEQTGEPDDVRST
ncbi:hypothetical protein O2W15_02140 [Modestobacter sp. VKM Ac-2979]|uniref:hypothetical protein n=1 Tax=unclassified Modestobacter TaxID=2643866 RepID=UPI0022AB8D37|nr:MULTISPECIES: hypothetical protein [unclassified Modestobacter]MCZ2810226.1 hypothetical protein [Modestobacter sp. VKM Ac-2979]MCZ2841712.1 hypothetical protein [Modestobacter sp. VKM Ac-2980]